MKKQDLPVLAGVIAILLACALTPDFLDRFIAITKSYPYLSSFVKFALLSTFGECLGLRVTAGVWNRPGFGVLPRALVWGILGMGIKMSFTVYATGVPNFLAEIGLLGSAGAVSGFGESVIRAFFISTIMNFTFAPFFMTLHKITDLHIGATGGSLKGFLTPIPMAQRFSDINWNAMWGFVFKKTLPLFWVPAHTITFLLPPYFQVLFAAGLGVVLGLLLALASIKQTKTV
ncbi:hypothetical protein LJC48_07620 [Desulfovibrio sp. OttesenSCG-928-C06]|nr:hypothetical protein [Desulfovibrio sp. OttesenSCG-928-C06]